MRGWRTLCGGFLAGLLVTGLVCGGAAGWLATRGVAVEVNNDYLVAGLKERIADRVGVCLPALLDQARQAVPERVNAELQKEALSIQITLGATQIELPSAAMEQLRGGMKQVVQRAVNETLDELADPRLIEQIANEVEMAVRQELGGCTLDWQPVPGFWSVPVVVRTVNEAHNDGLRLVIGAGGQDG
ncbi:MAG TPA: hypothetical protein GXZ96_05240 [Firmicutes bacterium]|nr:hypothetical protein [Bacillota bacterium]